MLLIFAILVFAGAVYMVLDAVTVRQKQIAGLKNPAAAPSPQSVKISDDDFRASVEGNQLRIQRERGTDVTLFSPRASGMGHLRRHGRLPPRPCRDLRTTRYWL